jgi:hypothetical protein
MSYPLFDDSKGYLDLRRGKGLGGILKRGFERRALNRCLRHVSGVEVVCDVPSGPGRLLDYWRRRSRQVIAVDLSQPFVDVCAARLKGTGGRALRGDAFRLAELVEGVDLVASVRFLYYFDAGERVRLLRSLAAVSRRYLLVQYKSCETRKGRRNMARARSAAGPYGKHFTDRAGIAAEVAAAGLDLIAIEPIGVASDRVFALAAKRLPVPA